MPRHDLPDSEVRLVTRLNQILRTLCVQYARCTLLTHAPRPLGSGTTPMSAIGSQLTQALGVQWAECLHGLFASGSVRAAFRPFYYLSIRLSASSICPCLLHLLLLHLYLSTCAYRWHSCTMTLATLRWLRCPLKQSIRRTSWHSWRAWVSSAFSSFTSSSCRQHMISMWKVRVRVRVRVGLPPHLGPWLGLGLVGLGLGLGSSPRPHLAYP